MLIHHTSLYLVSTPAAPSLDSEDSPLDSQAIAKNIAALRARAAQKTPVKKGAKVTGDQSPAGSE